MSTLPISIVGYIVFLITKLDVSAYIKTGGSRRRVLIVKKKKKMPEESIVKGSSKLCYCVNISSLFVCLAFPFFD